jgi:histone acetyltransferase (RNA polymerase elongator complex component)
MNTLKANIRHYNIPVFIPQMGCPFQCVFCNQNRISSAFVQPDLGEAAAVIENHLNTIPKIGSNVQIAFFGGSFTGLPSNVQEAFLMLGHQYIKAGRVNSLRLSTRPDFINREVLSLLKLYGVSSIELGAQSLDDDVLRLSGRGHTAKDVLDSSALIRSYGFSLGLQMMIGLPGDTKEKAVYTARKIVEAGADNTRVYPALVIRDTRLERWYHAKQYTPLSLDESLDWAVDIMEIFQKYGVRILRMGLHPSEGLVNGESLVAGPFHVSYRELVLSRAWRKRLEGCLNNKAENISIHVAPDQINYAVGHKSQNRNWLRQRFDSVNFLPDEKLKNREFYVDYR